MVEVIRVIFKMHKTTEETQIVEDISKPHMN